MGKTGGIRSGTCEGTCRDILKLGKDSVPAKVVDSLSSTAYGQLVLNENCSHATVYDSSVVRK